MNAAAWAAAGAVASTLIVWARTAWEKRKSSPETTAVLMGASMDFVTELRAEITQLRDEVVRNRTEVDVLRNRVRELENEIHTYHRVFGPLP